MQKGIQRTAANRISAEQRVAQAERDRKAREERNRKLALERKARQTRAEVAAMKRQFVISTSHTISFNYLLLLRVFSSPC